MKTSLTILLTLWLMCGCAVGPDYQRPGYPMPCHLSRRRAGYPHPAGRSFFRRPEMV